MDTFFSSPAGSKSIIPELKSWSPSGNRYSRTSAVDDEIQMILQRHDSEWIVEAPNLKNETIFFLMRLVRRSQEQLFYEFFQELCIRIGRIAKRTASRYRVDEKVIQEIVDEVQQQVLELVLTDEPGRQTDVLEYAFGQAIKRRARQLSRKHNNSVQARLRFIDVPPDYDDSAQDRANERLELTPDGRPSPEAIAIRNVLLEKAWAVIDDPRIYEAMYLHHYRGWPIDALMKHFGGAPRRHVKYMLEQGMQQMREAIGVQK